jgi:hypothetical protein
MNSLDLRKAQQQSKDLQFRKTAQLQGGAGQSDPQSRKTKQLCLSKLRELAGKDSAETPQENARLGQSSPVRATARIEPPVLPSSEVIGKWVIVWSGTTVQGMQQLLRCTPPHTNEGPEAPQLGLWIQYTSPETLTAAAIEFLPAGKQRDGVPHAASGLIFRRVVVPGIANGREYNLLKWNREIEVQVKGAVLRARIQRTWGPDREEATRAAAYWDKQELLVAIGSLGRDYQGNMDAEEICRAFSLSGGKIALGGCKVRFAFQTRVEQHRSYLVGTATHYAVSHFMVYNLYMTKTDQKGRDAVIYFHEMCTSRDQRSPGLHPEAVGQHEWKNWQQDAEKLKRLTFIRIGHPKGRTMLE